jgi:hypothetical protein
MPSNRLQVRRQCGSGDTDPVAYRLLLLQSDFSSPLVNGYRWQAPWTGGSPVFYD